MHGRHIGYTIDGRPILHDVNVHVRPGSFVGIVGPNGAGKTTLIRLLAGVARPTAGHIEFEGRPLASFSDGERARRIAYMSQNPGIGFGFTVWDVVAMGRYAHRRSMVRLADTDRAAVEEALVATDVDPLRDRPVTNLSGGERQRVFLARTLAQRPRLLFLDEPTSDLDVRYQLEILHLVQRLRDEQQLTVVMAIHDLTWALRFCDAIVALHAGRVFAAGPTETVVTEEMMARVFGVTSRIVREPGRPPRIDFDDACGKAVG